MYGCAVNVWMCRCFKIKNQLYNFSTLQLSNVGAPAVRPKNVKGVVN